MKPAADVADDALVERARTDPDGSTSDRRDWRTLVVAALFGFALAAGFAGLLAGPAALAPGDVGRALLAGMMGGRDALDLSTATIVLDIRLPRILTGLLVGASLALSGAIMQGLFRNPLADPGLVGVSSGAALAAVTVIVLGDAVTAYLPPILARHLLPIAAFFGGLVITGLIYRLATEAGRTSIAAMLLVGIALAALAAAATGVLVFVSTDQQLRELTFWTMGGLGGSTMAKLAAAAPLMLPAFLAAPWLARRLNALSFGPSQAFHMGVDVQATTRVGVFVIAAAVGASVAVSGIIGFIGLVAPHLVRTMIGPDHRLLLPAAALIGAGLVVLADIGARTLVAPAELPIGILTALIGAPFFLWLLLRRRGMLGT